MVFDRRFVADSLRYSRSGSNPQLQSDGLRPSLQDYCALLTRSFLMVLDGARDRDRGGPAIPVLPLPHHQACGSAPGGSVS